MAVAKLAGVAVVRLTAIILIGFGMFLAAIFLAGIFIDLWGRARFGISVLAHFSPVLRWLLGGYVVLAIGVLVVPFVRKAMERGANSQRQGAE
jgi:uncharacterized protein YqgC (DUF456 family)